MPSRSVVAIERKASPHRLVSVAWVSALFFCSGFPALIYQIVWERALFAFYGLNVQSVTIVVSAFMLGLGLGSLLGGALSENNRIPLVMLYSILEFATAIFGFFSLTLFRAIAQLTAGGSLLETSFVCFALVLAPTLLMGATLPLLVEYSVRLSHNVGSAVGELYFANTLGSGFACFVAGSVLLRYLGQPGSVRVAACVNVGVAVAALIYGLYSSGKAMIAGEPEQLEEPLAGRPADRIMPFWPALICSAFIGFVALAYEIVWYRISAFATGDTAPVFAFLLGSYLFGLALGSRWVERYSQEHHPDDARRALGKLILVSAVTAFSVVPAIAVALRFISPFAAAAKGLACLSSFCWFSWERFSLGHAFQCWHMLPSDHAPRVMPGSP